MVLGLDKFNIYITNGEGVGFFIGIGEISDGHADDGDGKNGNGEADCE